jgi:hypothetical protein
VSAGTRFEGFDITADELVFAFLFPQSSILAMDVQQARAFSKITGDPLDDDPRLFLSAWYTSPHCLAACLRRCKCREMKWSGVTELVQGQLQQRPALFSR